VNSLFWLGYGITLIVAFSLGNFVADFMNVRRAQRAADAEPFPEPDDAVEPPEDDDEDDDVCLRVGMRVICNLSPATHTHGVIIGFTMHADPDGPMLAIVNVGDGAMPMPINVDLVEPHGPPPGPGPGPGYRDNAKPDKQWN
jgi:hypothetical protein